MLTIVLLAIVIALLFDFLNGMNDAANSIATIVATRVFSPTMAVCWAAFWNFAAIFIFGVSVAHTMGEGISYFGGFDRFGDLGLVVYSFRYADQCVPRFDRGIDRSGMVHVRGRRSGCFRDIQDCHLYRAVPFDRYDTGILHDVSHDVRVS